MSIRVAREEMFKLIFEAEVNEENVCDLYGRLSEIVDPEIKLNGNMMEFIEKISKGISENYANVREVLDIELKKWKFERLGYVERALLIFGTYELMYKELGHEIVINEMVEIAKKYGEDRTYEFINGVFANIIKNRSKYFLKGNK